MRKTKRRVSICARAAAAAPRRKWHSAPGPQMWPRIRSKIDLIAKTDLAAIEFVPEKFFDFSGISVSGDRCACPGRSSREHGHASARRFGVRVCEESKRRDGTVQSPLPTGGIDRAESIAQTILTRIKPRTRNPG